MPADQAAPPAKPRRCPICGRPAAPEQRPFCSKRCREVDLGRWFSGAYAVPVAVPVETPDRDGGEEDKEGI